jgi:ABC-type glycerol-3-phosphate transport system substrate-binding protein
MSIAGGTAPNVIHVNGRQSGSYVARGFLHPLDDFVDTERTAEQAKADGDYDDNKAYLDELKARIKPQVWDAVYREGPDGKKHVYFMPFSYWVRVLAYNKSLFQEVGIDPETDYPKTWDELLTTAEQLHRPDQESYGMLVDTGGGASWIALPFFYAKGSRIVQYDQNTGDWRATFNDPAAIEAADFYLQLLRVGRTRDAWHLWDKGRVGMVLLYANDTLINMDSHISGLNPSEVGLVQIPAAPSGKSTTELHMRGDGTTGSVLFDYGGSLLGAGAFDSITVVSDSGTLTPGTLGSLNFLEYAIDYGSGTADTVKIHAYANPLQRTVIRVR